MVLLSPYSDAPTMRIDWPVGADIEPLTLEPFAP